MCVLRTLNDSTQAQGSCTDSREKALPIFMCASLTLTAHFALSDSFAAHAGGAIPAEQQQPVGGRNRARGAGPAGL